MAKPAEKPFNKYTELPLDALVPIALKEAGAVSKTKNAIRTETLAEFIVSNGFPGQVLEVAVALGELGFSDRRMRPYVNFVGGDRRRWNSFEWSNSGE